jgi:AcrR family transcriptional regulator
LSYCYSTTFYSKLEVIAKNPRTRTPSAGMEAALLDAAADILDREGPDSLSVRRIAAAAHVAPMGVYNHFEPKNGIIEALFIQGFERVRDALVGIADIQDPYEALREGGRRYRALAPAHPKVYELMFVRTMPGFEPSERPLEIATRAFDALVGAVPRAMAAGVIAEANRSRRPRSSGPTSMAGSPSNSWKWASCSPGSPGRPERTAESLRVPLSGRTRGADAEPGHRLRPPRALVFEGAR